MEGKIKTMIRWGKTVFAAFACFLPLVVYAKSVVTDIRIGVEGEETRILFEFTKETEAKVFILADPYRVVIDLPEVGWRLPPRPLPPAIGAYDKLRYGLYKPGNSRVVLDLREPARITNASALKPNGIYAHRLALRLTPVSDDEFSTAKKSSTFVVSSSSPSAATDQSTLEVKTLKTLNLSHKTPAKEKLANKDNAGQSSSKRAGRYLLAPRKPYWRREQPRHTVVIDPGHGGLDPGAIGISGTYEKHIALSMSRAIRDALEVYGIYKVSLTRDRDIFVPLRERIRIAREKEADLFISIHVDATKNRNVHGPSVYTLSEKASDKEAAALAEKENKVDLIAGIDLSNNSEEVTNILIDLAQRAAMNQSARFANLLVSHLKKRTKVLRNTHRFAGFAVLKAPDIPSVLLELGFLSNLRDERALRTSEYRKKLAGGIAKAVNNYFQQIEQAERR